MTRRPRICLDAEGHPEPDPELRDTDSVPLEDRVEEYIAREVLPYVADAWVDDTKTKVGYEIASTATFTVRTSPTTP